MDFYSGMQPNLIGPIMKKTVYTITEKKIVINNTISEQITSGFATFYYDYIYENKYLILFIIFIIILLFYRYNSVKTNKNYYLPTKKERFRPEDKNLLRQITDYQTAHLKYDNPPSMNPLNSPSDDIDSIFYPPDKLPINIPDQGIIYTRDLYDKPQQQDLYHPYYDYSNKSSRAYYTGTENTYKDSQPSNMVNPYSWSNDFNINSGKFVGASTYANKMNVNEFKNIVENQQNNLMNGEFNYS
jgi:hypothetical protein